MKIIHILFNVFLFIFSFAVFSTEIEIIELYDDIVDQSLLKNLDDSVLKNQKDSIINQENVNIINQEDVNITNVEKTINGDIFSLPDLWENTKKEDLEFLLNNISNISSPILRNELLAILDINSLPPKNFEKNNFDYLIIKSILKFGDKNKAYEIIKSFTEPKGKNYDTFYKEFELNYLLSTHNLTEACEFNKELKKLDINTNDNFFLKVDIFCLLIQEKIEEANLLNSLLEETSNKDDKYFQYLFDKIKTTQKNIEDIEDVEDFKINEKEIFLYIAMHRVGNIALTEKLLKIDPLNLSMPIILSNSSNIELRLKAAHFAYLNNILDYDSLSALYQMVDFSSDELENPLSINPKIEKNIEISMAYFYQLINIQILPISRLEAIISFLKFAEKNNLHSIAYELSKKGLDTIKPSNELSEYGPQIVRVYANTQEFDKAKKWLTYSEASNDLENTQELQSSKLLFNLLNIDDSEEFLEILIQNLKSLQVSSNQPIEENSIINNEILFMIFSIIDNNNTNPFILNKKLNDLNFMPSAYLIDNIKKCIRDNNDQELLLNIIASLEGASWSKIHSEHLQLILLGLKNYKGGLIFNKVLIEILNKNNII